MTPLAAVPVAGASTPGSAGSPQTAALIEQTTAEHPVLVGTGTRAQLLVGAWLASHRAAQTRAAYARDLAAWLRFLVERQVDVLAPTQVHVDLWARAQAEAGAAATSIARRLSALASFYAYCAAQDLITDNPVAGLRRPTVDPDHTATVGLTRQQRMSRCSWNFGQRSRCSSGCADGFSVRFGCDIFDGDMPGELVAQIA